MRESFYHPEGTEALHLFIVFGLGERHIAVMVDMRRCNGLVAFLQDHGGPFLLVLGRSVNVTPE